MPTDEIRERFEKKAREIAQTMRVEWAHTIKEANHLTDLITTALEAAYAAGAAEERERVWSICRVRMHYAAACDAEAEIRARGSE